MGGDGARRSSSLLMALLLLSFLCFVSAEILVKPAAKTVTGTTINQHLEAERIIETERHSLQRTNLNYVSKRRVPSEPDPIHNRYFQCFNISPCNIHE
uniref:CLE25 n=1 Tax=Solanum tuberosum TaxID=4113 RepID=M1A9F6_SOLTU